MIIKVKHFNVSIFAVEIEPSDSMLTVRKKVIKQILQDLNASLPAHLDRSSSDEHIEIIQERRIAAAAPDYLLVYNRSNLPSTEESFSSLGINEDSDITMHVHINGCRGLQLKFNENTSENNLRI